MSVGMARAERSEVQREAVETAAVSEQAAAISCRPRLRVDVDGGLVRLRADYDPQLVALIKELPDRRYLAERAEWTMPARRPALAALAELVGRSELDVELTARARRRIRSHSPGRLTLEEGELRLSFPYHPQRLERVRAIPERRFDSETKNWIVPATRAGALALLKLLHDGDFRAEQDVRRRLRALAVGHAGGYKQGPPGEVRPSRESPIAHWRHVTRGPIFTANPTRRLWVDGIGWCVRIRVDPSNRSRRDQVANPPATRTA